MSIYFSIREKLKIVTPIPAVDLLPSGNFTFQHAKKGTPLRCKKKTKTVVQINLQISAKTAFDSLNLLCQFHLLIFR